MTVQVKSIYFVNKGHWSNEIFTSRVKIENTYILIFLGSTNPMMPGGSGGMNPMMPGSSSGTNPMMPGGSMTGTNSGTSTRVSSGSGGGIYIILILET